MDRRKFLQASAATLLIPKTLGYTAEPSSKPKRVGLIGSGWYGKGALLRLLQVHPAEVVAICDVDRNMRTEAAELISTRQASHKKPKTYGDFRDMLKQEEFDIVQVSTPDHWHALAMLEAVKAGADVYVEKPISVDVIEGLSMLTAARKYQKIVQVNTQRRSTPHLIEARDQIIREGKLGKIASVEMGCYYHMRARGNPADTTPPDYLDYAMWSGPAPYRPYNPMVHPRSWRSFMEYGNGIIGDMCIHMYDMVRWILELDWPRRISSSGGILVSGETKANISDTQIATFDHDDLTVVWNHRTWGAAPDPDYPWGATLYGEKGTLKLSVHGYDFIPQGQGERIHKDVTYELEQYPEDKTEKGLEKHVAPAMRSHWLDFLNAIEHRSKPVADIEQGYISSASCILANLALKTGRTLEWDPVKNQIINDPDANVLLRRPYTRPWVHPEPETV